MLVREVARKNEWKRNFFSPVLREISMYREVSLKTGNLSGFLRLEGNYPLGASRRESVFRRHNDPGG
jgi:hypothetical protein